MKHGFDINISEMRLVLMAWMHLNKITNCVLVHARRRPCLDQDSTGSGKPDVAERSGALRRRAKPCVARTCNNLVWFTATATGAENIEWYVSHMVCERVLIRMGERRRDRLKSKIRQQKMLNIFMI